MSTPVSVKSPLKFQLLTGVMVVVLTALVNLGFLYHNDNRDDSKVLDNKLLNKLDVKIYDKDQSEIKQAVKENTDFRVATGADLSSIKTNIQWLVETQKQENKRKGN